MGSRGVDRAQAVQVGVVILFGFFVVAASLYQVTVVPDQNREVEFLHNQEVQTDVVELSNSVSATGTTGDAAPATVDLGTRYPSRTFFVNPPPATGSLRTVEPPGDGNVTLENVDVASSVDGEANDYWGDPANLNRSTRFVVYAPRYNQYREAPTTRIEQGVAFNNFSAGRNITLTDQQVVDGDRVTLLAVSGDLDRSGVSTVSVDPSSVSSIDRRERVSGELNVTFPTTLGAATWAELLSDEIDAGWVNDTHRAGPNRVTIELNDSRTYSLGIAAIHVGAGATDDPETAYLDVERAPTRMTDGSIREVVVEVRDEYGNPVAGGSVEAAAENGSFSRSTVRTGEDGIAVFEYRADGVGETDLNFSVGSGAPGASRFAPGTPLNATVTVEILADGSGGTGGGGGGGTGADQTTLSSSGSFSPDADAEDEGIEFTLSNGGTDTVTITGISVDSTSDPNANKVRYTGGNREFVQTDGPGELDRELNIDGTRYSLDTNATIPSSGSGTFRLQKFQGGGPPSDVDMAGDSVTITVYYQDGTSEQFTLTG